MFCYIVSFFRRILPSGKKSAESAIAPETYVPPPEYVQVCGTSSPLLPEKSSPPPCETATLLNPNLRFTADEIEGHLAHQDAIFASAVVELMLPRLRLGVWHEPVGWGHYSFTIDKVLSLLSPPIAFRPSCGFTAMSEVGINMGCRKSMADVTRRFVSATRRPAGTA